MIPRLLSSSSKCHLLGGIFSDALQLLLGICAIGSLVYKRHIERPQRPWKIWFFDVSKQLIGGFLVHCSNIYVAEILGSGDDECAWYFINFFVDCTFGVIIVYIAHGFICYLLIQLNFKSFKNIGQYGNPPNKCIWFTQCLVYIISLGINKIIVCLIFFSILSPLNSFADWLFQPLQSNPTLELVIVMIACPWFLTSIQFLLFDSMLKAKPSEDEHNDLFLLSSGSSINEMKEKGSNSYLSIDANSKTPSRFFSAKFFQQENGDDSLNSNSYVNMDSDTV